MVTSAKEKNKMEEERKLGGHFGTAKEGLLSPGGGEFSYCRKSVDL